MNDKVKKNKSDKSNFDSEYDYWFKRKKNTSNINKPRMECLEEILRYHKDKIPYDIISNKRSMWKNICKRNSNRGNFCYTIFISVCNAYLIRETNFLRPNDEAISKWWAKRK